ncbi:putative MFS-type transporter YusP [Cyphellophora attinorum]|uniref:Putative MFS-type transporter YusP n=1 Tax=Cyphellophora attinorum TaxID=1664694 RepID=A0A0N0NN17_9EURO|nr:putative MFS-type transporter YusP [Phialophora attinorum]KPI41091.1 putative MFS-type transporter YusP [Phialophora attinorum]
MSSVPDANKDMASTNQIESSSLNGSGGDKITAATAEHGHEHVAIHNDTYDIAESALGQNLPKNYYRSVGFIGTVVGLCFGNISNYTGWVLPSNSLLIINADIGPSPNITWVALSYTLGLTIGFLIIGRLSDIFGRRWFFIIGNGIGCIGAIIGATTNEVDTLIGANLLNGLAGAVQITFTTAISELVPNKHRPIWLGAIFSSSFQFACFGPVIAQAFVTGTSAGWRCSYYINIAMAGAATLCMFFFYHPPTFHQLHVGRSKMQQVKRQDAVGLVLFTGGLVIFLMGLNWGGSLYPWSSAHVIGTIVVGFVALVAFVIYDAKLHKGDPLLPMHLFKSPGYLAMVVTATVGSIVYYGMNVLWPQQIAFLFGGSAIHKGWLACVVGGGALLGQIIAAVLCQYIKRSRFILIGCAASLLAFCAAMIDVEVGDEAKGVAFMLLATTSVGALELCSLAIAPLALPTEDIGVALGALGSIRSGGASVGLAICVAILNNKLTAFVPPRVTEAVTALGLPLSSVPALLTGLTTGVGLDDVPGISPEILAAAAAAQSNAASDAFHYVWYAVVAFAVLALGCACFTINYGQFLTNDVSRKMHGKTVGVVEEEEERQEKSVV